MRDLLCFNHQIQCIYSVIIFLKQQDEESAVKCTSDSMLANQSTAVDFHDKLMDFTEDRKILNSKLPPPEFLDPRTINDSYFEYKEVLFYSPD